MAGPDSSHFSRRACGWLVVYAANLPLALFLGLPHWLRERAHARKYRLSPEITANSTDVRNPSELWRAKGELQGADGG